MHLCLKLDGTMESDGPGEAGKVFTVVGTVCAAGDALQGVGNR